MISLIFCLFAGLTTAQLPRLVTEFELPDAAVASVSPKFGHLGPSLLLTTFKPSGTDAVWVVPDIDKVLNNNATVELQLVENETQWPNMAEATSDGTLMLTACGFFVSQAKSTGSIDVFDVSNFPSTASRTKVSEDRKGNFYHEAVWFDVDQDGVQDIVAARAFKSLYNPFSKAEGELMWFKQSSDHTWETRYLTAPQGHDGPDVAFIVTDLDGDGRHEFVAAQFFTQQALVVWECNSSKWSDCENGNGVTSSIVDAGKDPFFNVQWVDLNMDGKKELLATTNTASGSGAVFAYEPIGDFRRGPSGWQKHTLATGYKPLNSILPGQGSPGTATAFLTSPSQPPVIVVSADDGGWFDLLTRQSKDQWSYSQTRLVTTKGTVGTMSTPTAIDDSGRKVMFLPLFHDGKVQMWVFE